MNNPLKCYYNPQFGWGFSIGSGQNRVRMKGFSTDLQAFEARKLVLKAISSGKRLPTEADLKKSVPEYFEETRAQVHRRRKVAKVTIVQLPRVTMRERRRLQEKPLTKLNSESEIF